MIFIVKEMVINSVENNNAKKWFKKCIVCLVGAIFLIIALVYVFDPYFHFHKPFSFVSYRLHDERYTNDGIARHFEYDAVITGTSMAQNFKPSEMDAIFGTKAIKTTFAGAGYQELSQHLERALQRNENLKTVVWTLDYNGLIREKDWAQYESYPTYLYDDNVWNDTTYVFNKSVLYHGVLTNLMKTVLGESDTTMDEYSSWDKETGLKYVMESYDRNDVADYLPSTLEEDEAKIVRESITENIVNLVNQYPDTTFYIFYSPYSICYWDSLALEGTLQRQFQAEQLATELLLKCPNVRLYNFFENYDVICDLSYYRDKEHYSAEVNSMILQWLMDDTYLITQNNYMEKLAKEKEFYMNYDYNSIYE